MRIALLTGLLVTLSTCAIQANAQFYYGVSLGLNQSADVTVKSRSNDRSSVCDEYINPRALDVPGCTSSGRGSGDGWQANFDSARGLSGELELGYRLLEKTRISGVYSYEITDFDQTVSSSDASGVDFDKISNELAIGEETLSSVRTHKMQLNVYRDWPNNTLWTPFVGVGILFADVSKKFSWHWERSSDPDDISTGVGQPNVDEIRRNLAGTISSGRSELSDQLLGYTLILGLNRKLSRRVSIDLKSQWSDLGTFQSEAYDGETLRSHIPNLRLDQSEPVQTWSDSDDTNRLTTSVAIRVSFP